MKCKKCKGRGVHIVALRMVNGVLRNQSILCGCKKPAPKKVDPTELRAVAAS